MYALHHNRMGTRRIGLLADLYEEINAARAQVGQLCFDGLLVQYAAEAAHESEPTLALAALDDLIQVAEEMKEEINSILNQSDTEPLALDDLGDDEEVTD